MAAKFSLTGGEMKCLSCNLYKHRLYDTFLHIYLQAAPHDLVVLAL